MLNNYLSLFIYKFKIYFNPILCFCVHILDHVFLPEELALISTFIFNYVPDNFPRLCKDLYFPYILKDKDIFTCY